MIQPERVARDQVDCPRARTWMTPCIARDGDTALADPPEAVCVGCGSKPRELLIDLGTRYQPARQYKHTRDPGLCADLLTRFVGEYVAAKPTTENTPGEDQ